MACLECIGAVVWMCSRNSLVNKCAKEAHLCIAYHAKDDIFMVRVHYSHSR